MVSKAGNMPSAENKGEAFMGIATWIAIGVIVLIVGLAAGYVIKSKKKGSKCIGCPESGSDCCCTCHRKSE